jgi:allantoicase
MSGLTIKEKSLAGLVNLADSTLGARAVYATDEFFAPKERMLEPTEPVARPNTYDQEGQWMDGWETRRRRDDGHDACVITLAYPGAIHFVDLDTRHFTGNFPPRASIDATTHPDPLDGHAEWVGILPVSALTGDAHNLFGVTDRTPWRHLRLNILPDGGIARFRVYGEVGVDWASFTAEDTIDLFAIENGGRAIACNDQHYGNIHNLNRPGRGKDMGDGWETRRRREPGFDWVILQLGHRGIITRIEIDTAHFKGNYPDRVSVQAALITETPADALPEKSMDWPSLLPPQAMSPDAQHSFEAEVSGLGPVSHVRVNLHPDGGLSRVRLYGNLARS